MIWGGNFGWRDRSIDMAATDEFLCLKIPTLTYPGEEEPPEIALTQKRGGGNPGRKHQPYLSAQ